MNPTPHPDRADSASEAEAIRIHRQLLGDLSPEEFEKLEHDMIASPGLRERFLRAVRIEMNLRDHSLEPVLSASRPLAGFRWTSFASVVSAIAALLLLAATLVWRNGPVEKAAPAASVAPTAEVEVATLVDVRDCRWAREQSLELDERFAAGVVELTAGVAVFQFDGGSRLVLQGPASMEIIGPKTARLHHGNATVRCEQGLYNFSLLTPTSTVVDLGTEFGVSVDSSGASEVHVLDGAVEVVDTLRKFEPGIRFLNAGQTLALAADGAEKIIGDTTRAWIRDYSTPQDRELVAQPPRLIARDPFPHNHQQPLRMAMGTGWSGAWWQATRSKPGDFRFVPMGPLTKRDRSDGLAMLVGGWVEVRRTLVEPVDPTRSQVIYVGLSIHRVFPEHRDNGRLSEGTFLFRSSEDPTAVLAMGLSPLNYWVVAEQGGWERSDQPETGKGPFFMVARVEFNPVSGNKVSMMAFGKSEVIPSSEPEKWDFITQRQHTKMSVPLDTVALRVRQSAFKFGELSIGNSWQSVVDPASVEQ